MAPEPPSAADEAHDGPALDATEALKTALAVLDNKTLLDLLFKIIDNNPIVQRSLERSVLVRGEDVVRYDADTDSGDGDNGEGDDCNHESLPKRKPLRIKDNEVTGRIAMCLNCEKRFDVTQNKKGDCVYHDDQIGSKDVEFGNDFWADHDENCHGPYESFIDDEDFAEGFIWSCCGEQGNNTGCHSTKHQAHVNTVVSDEAYASAKTGKRKAEEQLTSPRTGPVAI